MSTEQRIPDQTHPITVTPAGRRVVVTVADTVVADSRAALSLQEASYPAVLYIPREDIRDELLTPSATESYCPYKGEASYWSLDADGADVPDLAWSYEKPYEAVSEITGHLAFYPDKASVREVND